MDQKTHEVACRGHLRVSTTTTPRWEGTVSCQAAWKHGRPAHLVRLRNKGQSWHVAGPPTLSPLWDNVSSRMYQLWGRTGWHPQFPVHSSHHHHTLLNIQKPNQSNKDNTVDLPVLSSCQASLFPSTLFHPLAPGAAQPSLLGSRLSPQS